MSTGTRPAGRLTRLAVGAVAARAALRAATAVPATAQLSRTNFRGRTVGMAGGPALAVSASVSAALGAPSPLAAAAALTAGLGAGAVGRYDDVVGARPEQKTAKGFRGHLAALREGRVTSGLVKVAGVGAAGLAASALLSAEPPGYPPHRDDRPAHAPRVARRALDVLLGAGVIAGAANLVNLLDLRPGRALKSGLLVGAPLLGGPGGDLAAGAVGAAAGLLGADLRELTMLGDCGANALGALLGVAYVRGRGTIGRAAALGAIAALTAASERVSFTKVIERTPVLRELDTLGRRTA